MATKRTREDSNERLLDVAEQFLADGRLRQLMDCATLKAELRTFFRLAVVAPSDAVIIRSVASVLHIIFVRTVHEQQQVTIREPAIQTQTLLTV